MSVALESTLDPARAVVAGRPRHQDPPRGSRPSPSRLLALLAAAVIFSLFLLVQGKSPVDFFKLMYTGGFGTWFSLQNTLQRAAPLLLTALCVAIPAQLGLVVIGGEGALVLGGLAAAAIALPLLGCRRRSCSWPWRVAGCARRRRCASALVGVLRHYRGVNETISSLLIAYIAIAIMNHIVEGPLRDPASLNKPSTGRSATAYSWATCRAWMCIGGWWPASSPASSPGC